MVRSHIESPSRAALGALLVTWSALAVAAAEPVGARVAPHGFGLEVLVGGRALPQHPFRGARYVEARAGREYSLRLRNPLPVRVAVALSVDGLNTIDARHGDARTARKWVLGPYETVTIEGWQTSVSDARRFYFTTESNSYATWLGEPANQGVISAVFYRERPARITPLTAPAPGEPARDRRESPNAPAGATSRSSGAPLGAQAAKGEGAEELAATGFGRTVEHAVRQVHLDLEDSPVATIDIRYEFREQLVRLGVLPPGPAPDDPLDRRERARGFTDGFCPVPGKR
jgi:hypothetical protein